MTPPRTDASQVGLQLQQARDHLDFDIEDAVAASGLSASTIRTLEQDDPAAWGSDTSMLAALRIYARRLRLNPEPMVVAAWSSANAQSQPPPVTPVEPLMPGPSPRAQRRRRRLRAGVTALSIVVAGGVALTVLMTTGDDGAAPADPADDPASDPRSDTAEGNEPQPLDPDASGLAPDASGNDQAGADEAVADELAGRPPQETPVQVLDALGDEQVTAEAVRQLEGLGYDVVLVDSTIQPWDETAVYYESGWETEAESLHARDDRFVVGGPNVTFLDDAGLHVVIGLDWTE